MLSEVENINYLYLVLTNDGNPTIDWDAVSSALDLEKGAVTKRWSRLKQAMEKNDVPGGTTYQFLWLCVKHNTRAQPPNWNDIAAKANTTAGAASKRYSRMKKAFEENGTAPCPSSLAKDTPRSTVKKSRKTATSSGDDVDVTQTTPTPKRKRASQKKKIASTKDEAKYSSDPENEDDQEELLESKPKRAKVGKTNSIVTPKPKPKSIIKEEETSKASVTSFSDAQESSTPQDEAGEVDHDTYSIHERKLPYSLAPQRLYQRAENPLAEPADSIDPSDDFV
ncbi:hypothetical protein AA0111_g6709 [Alternaria arborescens]|uniref:hypothetical protein n=1 Tax=Alternaria arborescens TaxID=156630 RepID=UPI001075577E|nr:hypothetical protein AA0111_g6709 [Alternaria arborescens]RYO28704.1 hypothetical protein AA0111_g6709 [Alternaria arborescens]